MEYAMTNNQNWPDRVYFHHEVDEPSNWVQGFSYYPMCDTKLNNDSIEYISAEKVREIQLATIEHVISHCLGLIEKNRNLPEDDQFDIDKIDPKLLLKEIK